MEEMAILNLIYPLVSFGLFMQPAVAVALGLTVSFSSKWILDWIESRQEKKREVTMREKIVPKFSVCILEVVKSMGTIVAATAVLTKG